MDINNRVRGLKAKRNGETFERIFKRKAVAQEWTAVEIPPGCKSIGRNKLIRIKSPFDIMLCKAGRAIFLDLKTLGSGRFPRSAITPHQVEVLCAIESQWLVAGYLCNFRDEDQIVYFRAQDLRALHERESLGPEDGIILGSIADFNLDLIFSEQEQPETRVEIQ